MGFRKHPLSRRMLIELLEHNGFVKEQREHKRKGSHVRYVGFVDGKRRAVDVDQAIDDFRPESHSVLFYIVTTQVGFGPGGWKRFYAGHPNTAKQHGLTYKKW